MMFLSELFKLIRCIVWIAFFIFLILYFTGKITLVFYYISIVVIFAELIKILLKP